VDMIISERCTMFYGDPILHRGMQKISNRIMTSLRLVFLGSSTVTSDLIVKIKENFPVPFVARIFGMTEVSGVLQSLPEDSNELQCTTVGLPSEIVEVKLVDSNNRVVPVGAEGLLCVRGITAVTGIYGEPKLDENNWFHSGDLMVMLPSGHFRHLARMGDVIILPDNVIPFEVEEHLNSHPKVEESQVFGVTRKFGIEEVAAWVILKEAEEMDSKELQNYCAEKLSLFKIPKHVHFVKEFPKNSRGKVLKNVIREKATKLIEEAAATDEART